MTTDLTAAFAQVFGTPTWTTPPDPASHEDEATLRRSFGGLSRGARRRMRGPVRERPTEPWADELSTRAERTWAGEAS